MSEFKVTVPKRYFNQILKWNTIPSNTRIKLILTGCMPKNAHEIYCIIICVQIIKKKKKKKKKDGYSDPPNFQSKRANKPFIF